MNTKDNIATILADKHSITKTKAKEFVETVFEALVDKINSEDRVLVSGLGTFETKERAAREGRNPQTQEKIQIPARKALVFKATKSLKERVNEKA